MTCKDYLESIDRRLDEALTASQRTAFDSHVLQCPSCKTAFEQAQALSQLFQELPKPACPEIVVNRIYAQTIGIGRHTTAPAASSWRNVAQDIWQRFLPRPALAGWFLMMLMMVGSYFISKNIYQPAPPVYSAAELEKVRNGVHQAFGLFFSAVKKSEKLTREEVFRKKIILPVQEGFRQAYQPILQEGEL